jgi:hypothetical protein
MFFSLLRQLWPGERGPSGASRRQGMRPAPCRPRLEILEDRLPLAAWTGALPALAAETFATGAAARPALPAATPDVFAALPAIAAAPAAGANRMTLTVEEDSPATVIDLGAVFRSMNGIRHEDGLRLSVLGNTNSALVKTDLSEAALTLIYARGKQGKASITVCATDADGVSVKETLFITIVPRVQTGLGGEASLPVAKAPTISPGR